MFRRRVEVEVDLEPGVGYRSRAEFEDYNHHIVLDMVFQYGTGVVLSAEAKLLKHPFEECLLAMESVKSLIGFRAVNFGSRKEVYKRVAGPKGCTHLAELVMESINARIQAGDKLVPDWVDPAVHEERRRIWEQAWKDTCIHYTDAYWNSPRIGE